MEMQHVKLVIQKLTDSYQFNSMERVSPECLYIYATSIKKFKYIRYNNNAQTLTGMLDFYKVRFSI